VLAREPAGFTLVELLIAMAITLAVSGAALTFVQPAQATLRSQLQQVDARQRMRVAVDALMRDLTVAGSGLPTGSAPLTEYAGRHGEAGLTVRYADPMTGVVASHSYYVLASGTASGSELRRWNGTSDAPVADGIESIAFGCWDASDAPIVCGAAAVRRVRVALTAQGGAEHLHVTVDAAPRCLQDGE
jgi:prepilin-type N-terminal cleavage/methylation domain-containing protein